MVLTGVAVAYQRDVAPSLAVFVIGLALATTFHSGRAAIRPGLPRPERIFCNTAVPFAVVAAGAVLSLLRIAELRSGAALLLAMAGCDVVATVLRHRLERPIRVLLVGDMPGITRLAGRLERSHGAHVIGGLLVSGADDDPPVAVADGVRVVRGVGQVAHWVDHWAADLVVVAPGNGLDSSSIQRLGWLLESSDASIAVAGPLHSVAPHRVDVTTLGRTTLVHARSSRPSAFIRGTKWTIDRLLGLLLLLLATPLLLCLWAWVRLDSRGPGLFVQTRIGQEGRPFRMFKLRTMHCDAEAQRAALAGVDDGNGVLFKMHADPRVTRAGRILRKCSLDELPQLINVVRGEMSLVGPRPALPDEVEAYDELARRRLAVRPGLTGLWQVSGRSDLTWEESIDLDVHYTDNYRLTDDLVIGLRTVGAVARARGAY